MSGLDLTEAYGDHQPRTLYSYIDYQTDACADHGARPDEDADPEGADEWDSLHPLGDEGHYCLDDPWPGQYCRCEEHDDVETTWPCEYAQGVQAAAPIIARQAYRLAQKAIANEDGVEWCRTAYGSSISYPEAMATLDDLIEESGCLR